MELTEREIAFLRNRIAQREKPAQTWWDRLKQSATTNPFEPQIIQGKELAHNPLWDTEPVRLLRGGVHRTGYGIKQSIPEYRAGVLDEPTELKEGGIWQPLGTEYPQMLTPSQTKEISTGIKQETEKLGQQWQKNRAKEETWREQHPELQVRPEFSEGVIENVKKKNWRVLKDPDYYISIMASNAVPTIASLGASVGGAMLTGNPMVGMAASTAIMTSVQMDDIVEDMMANGATFSEATKIAPQAAVIISALESAGDLPILKSLSPAFAKVFGRNVSKSLAKELIKGGLKIEASEAFTESLQQIVQNAAVKTTNKERSLLQDIPETFVQTLISTLPFAGAGTISEINRDANIAQKASQIADTVNSESGQVNLPNPQTPPQVQVAPKKRIDDIISLTQTEIVQDKPGAINRLFQKVPIVEKGMKFLRPGLRMIKTPEGSRVLTGMMSQVSARSDVQAHALATQSEVFKRLESAFGEGSLNQDAKSNAVYIGTKPTSITGTILDIANNPEQYKLTREQKQALASLESHNNELLDYVNTEFNGEIGKFMVKPDGAFLPNVGLPEEIEDAIGASHEEYRNLVSGHGKERYYITAAERMSKDPKFKPITDIKKLVIGLDSYKATVAGANAYRQSVGGLTELKGVRKADYEYVGNGINRYFPKQQARMIKESLKTTNNPLFNIMNDWKESALNGDASPLMIQGTMGWLSNPIRGTEIIVGGLGRGLKDGDIFRATSPEALSKDIAANPTRFAQYAALNGRNLGKNPLEYSSGWLGKLPIVGKGFENLNTRMFTLTTRLNYWLWEANSQDLRNAGYSPDESDVAAASIGRMVQPQIKPSSLGQSLSRSGHVRAVVISEAFIRKPAEFLNVGIKGWGKIISNQPMTAKERLASKVLARMIATTMIVSVTSATLSSVLKGDDEETVKRNALEALNPLGSKAFGITVGNRYWGLAQPLRALYRACLPQDVAGVPFKVPLAGIPRYMRNRISIPITTQLDLIRNKDYYGNKIYDETTGVPTRLLQGLLYEFENMLPLAVGTLVEGKRLDKDFNITKENAISQAMGVNLQDATSLWDTYYRKIRKLYGKTDLSQYDIAKAEAEHPELLEDKKLASEQTASRGYNNRDNQYWQEHNKYKEARTNFILQAQYDLMKGIDKDGQPMDGLRLKKIIQETGQNLGTQYKVLEAQYPDVVKKLKENKNISAKEDLAYLKYQDILYSTVDSYDFPLYAERDKKLKELEREIGRDVWTKVQERIKYERANAPYMLRYYYESMDTLRPYWEYKDFLLRDPDLKKIVDGVEVLQKKGEDMQRYFRMNPSVANAYKAYGSRLENGRNIIRKDPKVEQALEFWYGYKPLKQEGVRLR